MAVWYLCFPVEISFFILFVYETGFLCVPKLSFQPPFHTLPSIFHLSSSNRSCFQSLRVLAWFHPGSPSSFLWDNAVSKLLPVWWVQMTPRTILGKLTSELAPDGVFDLRVVSCYLWPFWHPLIFGFGGGSLSLPLLTVCQWIFV